MWLRAAPALLDRREPTRRLDALFDDIIGRISLAIHAALEVLVSRAFDKMAGRLVKAHQSRPADIGLEGAIEIARAQNIELIAKTSRQLANDVRDIMESLPVGTTVRELRARIRERGGISERHADLIARDQTLKLNAAITRIKQTEAGITHYMWSTSLDERVRPTHAELESRVFSWAEGTPIGYHPGEDIQCRCVAVPVLEDSED